MRYLLRGVVGLMAAGSVLGTQLPAVAAPGRVGGPGGGAVRSGPALGLSRGPGRGGPGRGGWGGRPGGWNGHPGGWGGRRGGYHSGFRGRFGYSYPGYYLNSYAGFYPYSFYGNSFYGGGFYPYSFGGYYPYPLASFGPPYGGIVGGYYGPAAYAQPDVLQVSPQIVYVQPPAREEAAPPVRDREPLPERPLPRDERDRYYLEGRRRAREEDPRPPSVLEVARRQIRAEKVEPDLYLVRWLGPAVDIDSVEFQAVDATGQVLGSRLIKEAPFRGLLRVPEKTARVLVSVEQKGGASASVKLPVAEFRALEAEERVIK